MGYRYRTLPEVCRCTECGYEIRNPGRHCREIACPRCGGVMRRVR